MSSAESFQSSLLLATLPTLSPPHFLSQAITTATTLTNDKLYIVLFSRFFNACSEPPQSTNGDAAARKTHHRRLSYPETQAISHTEQSNWNAVQRLLTFVYVQASKVATEQGRVLMDITVLLKGYNEEFTIDGVNPEIVFRVSGDSIPTPLPPSIRSLRTSYIPPGEVAPEVSAPPQTTPLEKPTPLHALPTSSLPAVGVAGPSPIPEAGGVPISTTHTCPHATQAQVTAALDGNVPDMPAPVPTGSSPPIKSNILRRPPFYPVVALGGTFDHLHAGHKILLSMGAWIASRKLIVGITGDSLLVKKPNAHLIEPISVRMDNVRKFLNLFKPGIEYFITELTDVYGPTGYDPDVQALVVSRETRKGGEMIATHRAAQSLPALETFTIDVISATHESLEHDDAASLAEMKMSSTAIRAWIADKQKTSKD